MELEPWLKALNYSAVTAILAFIGWGIVKVARYLAPHGNAIFGSLLGLIQDGRATINKVGENSTHLISITQTQAEASARIEAGMAGCSNKIEALGQRVDEHGETLEEIKSRLPKAGG